MIDDKIAWRRAGGWLERAHLVDHCLGGSGEPENLVPLCHFCHRAMTPQMFSTREAALEWVTERQTDIPAFSMWQAYTDGACLDVNDPPAFASKKALVNRLRLNFLALYGAHVVEMTIEGIPLSPAFHAKPRLADPVQRSTTATWVAKYGQQEPSGAIASQRV